MIEDPDVDREVCRICGRAISRTRVFFHDEPPGTGWVHRDCLFEEVRQRQAGAKPGQAGAKQGPGGPLP